MTITRRILAGQLMEVQEARAILIKRAFKNRNLGKIIRPLNWIFLCDSVRTRSSVIFKIRISPLPRHTVPAPSPKDLASPKQQKTPGRPSNSIKHVGMWMALSQSIQLEVTPVDSQEYTHKLIIRSRAYSWVIRVPLAIKLALEHTVPTWQALMYQQNFSSSCWPCQMHQRILRVWRLVTHHVITMKASKGSTSSSK